MKAKYIGKNESLGFIKDHVYDVDIEKRKYGYTAITTLDITDNASVNLSCTYTSQTSVDQNWEVIDD